MKRKPRIRSHASLIDLCIFKIRYKHQRKKSCNPSFCYNSFYYNNPRILLRNLFLRHWSVSASIIFRRFFWPWLKFIERLWRKWNPCVKYNHWASTDLKKLSSRLLVPKSHFLPHGPGQEALLLCQRGHTITWFRSTFPFLPNDLKIFIFPYPSNFVTLSVSSFYKCF